MSPDWEFRGRSPSAGAVVSGRDNRRRGVRTHLFLFPATAGGKRKKACGAIFSQAPAGRSLRPLLLSGNVDGQLFSREERKGYAQWIVGQKGRHDSGIWSQRNRDTGNRDRS